MRCLGLTVALLLGGPAAFATDFDFEGLFTRDNDVALVGFTVGADSVVTVFTSSWIQQDPPMGFDPIVSIWDAMGIPHAIVDDGNVAGSALSNGVSYDYGVWDAYFTVPLSAGYYQATVTQSDNNPIGDLSDGFRHDGDDNFTRTRNPSWDPNDPTYFYGLLGEERTGDWALHVTHVSSPQSVPEPSTWLLLGLGGLVIARLRRRALPSSRLRK